MAEGGDVLVATVADVAVAVAVARRRRRALGNDERRGKEKGAFAQVPFLLLPQK